MSRRRRDFAQLSAWELELRNALRDQAEAAARVEEAVAQLKGFGATWADIGRIAGVAPSNAHYRWGRTTSGKRVSSGDDAANVT